MIGFGVKIKRWNAGIPLPVWVVFANVFDIKPPEKTVGTTDMTDYSSPSKYREHEATLKDGGEYVISLNWDDTAENAYDILDADFEAGSKSVYEIVFPDTGNTAFDFLALVTKVGTVTPLDNKMTAEFTFKVIRKPIKIHGTAPVLSGVIAAGGTLAVKTYDYQISAYDGTKWSKVSNQISETLVDASGNYSVNLSWTYSGAVTKYRIWRTGDSVFDGYYDLITTSLLTLTDDGSLTFELTDSEIF